MIGNIEQVKEWIEKQQDGMFEIKKKQLKSIRSLAQNKYYWSVVVTMIGDFHGYTPVETHELLKAIFKLETTTDLAIDEFKAMIDNIRDLWSAKFDCYIPLPSDLAGEENLYKSLGF